MWVMVNIYLYWNIEISRSENVSPLTTHWEGAKMSDFFKFVFPIHVEFTLKNVKTCGTEENLETSPTAVDFTIVYQYFLIAQLLSSSQDLGSHVWFDWVTE